VPSKQCQQHLSHDLQPVIPALLEMDCSRLQKKLFPLDPVTIAAFKANARGHYDSKSPVMVLFWKVLEEDLTEEQLAGLFYFATNFHTLCNATQHISISVDSSIRDGLPRAATCSWSLRLPNYMVSGVHFGCFMVWCRNHRFRSPVTLPPNIRWRALACWKDFWWQVRRFAFCIISLSRQAQPILMPMVMVLDDGRVRVCLCPCTGRCILPRRTIFTRFDAKSSVNFRL
jgi:hypothetical protein